MSKIACQLELDIHSYNTKNNNNFTIKKLNIEKFKQSPTYTEMKFINNLPDDIKY